MDSTISLSAASDGSDTLLARLHDVYTRQKRKIAVQKRKQVDVELQAAAAHCSDQPVSLELLSDGTAALFNELEALLESRNGQSSASSRGVTLLQHIRQQANRELRESLSFIEEGYTSGFEKILRECRFEERKASLPKAVASSLTTATVLNDVQHSKASAGASSTATLAAPSHLPVAETLSASISFMAESLAVLLQCEVVRVYLYDIHAHLQCVAQFPYRAERADPMQSSYLAMMAVREVHHIVCQERLVINGWLSKSHDANEDSDTAAAPSVVSSTTASGLEDIHTCLLLPIFSPQGAGKPYGMVHAVNKQCPTALGVTTNDSAEVTRVGFTAEDEMLASSVARVLGTLLSRYQVDSFAAGIGEKLRRSAFPGDAEVLSLTAHLPPTLRDEVQEAAEVAQLALSHLTPILVHRVPMNAIYETRTAAGEGRRRKLALLGPREGAISSVEFNLRCMNELWESSRDDNVTLHKQYRGLEEQVHRMRLLLRNLLDGVAAARAMPLSPNVALFLQNLEMYGRSERTERMAAYVSEQMLAIPAISVRGRGAVDTHAEVPQSESDTSTTHGHMKDSELQALRNRHACLNTVTPASLHFDGPSGVRAYTSDPAQKREQVRFIDELCRLAEEKNPLLPPAPRGDARRQAVPRGPPAVTHATVARHPKPVVKPEPYPFVRPFKM
ncbi:hypothetical protein Q4I32_003359 [Leishmania shawi]|uniref:GAF domain-containing protein n=1 Tax=Leishmania shawi TaxID=5680 RepID=A0AAW3BXF6_9TRYP